MQDNRKKNSKNGKSKYGGLIAIVLVFIVNILSSLDSDGAAILIAVLAIFIFVGVLFAVVLSIIKKSAGTAEKPFGASKKGKGFTMPVWNRDDVEIPLSAPTRASSPAIYDEKAAEHNFIRDRDRRIAQLDGFLKNGIIEKDEYNILKARYMKNYQ